MENNNEKKKESEKGKEKDKDKAKENEKEGNKEKEESEEEESEEESDEEEEEKKEKDNSQQKKEEEKKEQEKKQEEKKEEENEKNEENEKDNNNKETEEKKDVEKNKENTKNIIIDNEKEEEEEENDEEENSPSSSINSEDETFFKNLIFSKYKPVKKLGEGSFGKVYKAEYNSQYYAIKFENREEGQDLLQNEATIMSYLKGNPHIPKVRSYGFKGNYNILVMQLLDKSLEDLFNIRKKFSFKTGAMLAYQMICALQYIHEKHIIHRDIKPDNFVLGSGELNAYLYLVDFGLAKKYRSSKTLKQIPYIKKKKLTGTARYASIHAMEEMEQSRRDDLEAVGYVLMYFIRGNLPWQGLKLKSNEDRYKKILEKKKEISTEELCAECPKVFYEYVKYTKKLGYNEEPKYEEFKNKFVNYVVNIKKEKFDFIFDWNTKKDINKRKEEFNITCPPLEGEDNGSSIFHLKDANNSSSGESNKEDEYKSKNKKKEGTKKGKGEETKEGNEEENKEAEDKVESGCCIMQVNIFFII